MLDPNIKATGTLVAEPELAAKEVPQFVAEVKNAFAAVAKVEVANSVQVSPGGKTFSTITDALNSITDASIRKQYVVSVGPGTYNEVVVCKPYVFIQGAGTDQTTVTADATGDTQANKGTVRGCSNGAIQNMTVISVAKNWADWGCAVAIDAAQNFDVENCVLQVLDQTGQNGANTVTLSIDYSATGGGSQVNVAYCTITVNGGASPIGLVAFANSFVQVTDSKIVASGSSSAWGGASNGGSNLNLYNCYVEGSMSLNIPDYTSHITANDCQLVGPYSNGVVIVNS